MYQELERRDFKSLGDNGGKDMRTKTRGGPGNQNSYAIGKRSKLEEDRNTV